MAVGFLGNNQSKTYWRGVLDTCEYFRYELGIQDALDTNMALWAMEALGESKDEQA